MGLVAETFLVMRHGLGGDRMSWGMLVSVGTSTAQKWLCFENQTKRATAVMDVAHIGCSAIRPTAHTHRLGRHNQLPELPPNDRISQSPRPRRYRTHRM